MEVPRSSFRAHGKCLLVGGYAVLYPSAVGLVIQTDSHWFEAVTTQTEIVSTEMTSSGCSTERIEVAVSTPQFPKENQYSVVFEKGEGDRGVKVVERSGNVFVDAAVEYAVKALGGIEIEAHWGLRFLVEVRQSMGFVKDEYCILDEKGVRFTKPVGSVEKTGMGSSSCLTAAIVGSLIHHLQTRQPVTALELAKDQNYLRLVNITAQIAHSVAQGKIGSGFDISCAVYGTQIFTRLPSNKLQEYQNVLDDQKNPTLGFSNYLKSETNSIPEIAPLTLPNNLHLLMLEYSSGTDTRLSIKKVTQFLQDNSDKLTYFLQESRTTADLISQILKKYSSTNVQKELRTDAIKICKSYRSTMKTLGDSAGVEIEPDLATSLLDKITTVDSVLFACCPGAGGYDALAVLVAADTPEELEQQQTKIMQAAISIKEPIDGLKFLVSPHLN